MKKLFLLLIIILCVFQKNFAQNNAFVCGHYYDSAYMDTLKGRNIQFSQQFLDSIQRFKVIKYYQSFPSINISSLKSMITFICPPENAQEFANYLQTYESSAFTDVYFELPVVRNVESVPYVPIDYYWNRSRIFFTNYYGNVPLDYMWHLKIIQADYAWTITQGDPNIKIGIIDRGFNNFHPDLVGKINTYDPFDNSIICNPYEESHGTEVACIAAGNTDESNGWWF